MEPKKAKQTVKKPQSTNDPKKSSPTAPCKPCQPNPGTEKCEETKSQQTPLKR